MAVREYEKDIKALDDYKSTCLASPVLGGAQDEVECEAKSFSSPLDFFSDVTQIENMT